MQQLGVSFVGGYIAGVFCAIVSHPADTMVSKLNAQSKTGVKPTVGAIYQEIGFGGLLVAIVCTNELVLMLGKSQLGWTRNTYCHDWYTHRSAMAHLRLRQGLRRSTHYRKCGACREASCWFYCLQAALELLLPVQSKIEYFLLLLLVPLWDVKQQIIDCAIVGKGSVIYLSPQCSILASRRRSCA